MNNRSLPGYRVVTLSPEGRPFLACRFLCPDDFALADLPAEELDLEKPARFLAVVVAVANYGPVVFSVGARPAYEGGTVAQWLAWLCREEGYEAGAVEIAPIGKLQAATCDAFQVGDGVTMRMRLVLIEDGGRLFQLSAMAPTQLWPAAADTLQRMLESFELAEVQGPRAALTPTKVTPEAAAHAFALATDEAKSAESVSAPSARLTPEEFSELVLADDMSALDPEQRTNANLRARGIGFVPNIVSVDREKKAVRVAAGAIEAFFTVPFGWHVNDDGRRTLVFDGDGRMQISLNLRHRDGASMEELGRSFVAPYLEKQPDVQVFTHEADGIRAVGVRGIAVEGEVLDQAFLFRETARPGVVLVARATGNSGDIRLAMNLAGEILFNVEEMAEAAVATSN